MAGKTQTHEVSVINTLRGTTLTGITSYASLLTAVATDTTTGTEVSGNAYARQLLGLAAPSGSPSSSSNAADINFPAATPAGYSPVQIGVNTAASAGTLVGYVPAFTAVPIAVTGQARIAAGGLVYTED